ncbi:MULTISPECIES: SphA family protein [unclassified Meridianimarinicoccus]|uniref:SphA family protein n=1 Tax=unclassified Meridianimarinicoccus TaxID=2923344 RepID=UPI001868384F|nr:transporter [Fluviibacterium sp. MJW13]
MHRVRPAIASLALLLAAASGAHAVEGGMGAYLLGSRTTFSGIVPGPGTYVGFDVVTSEGSVQGLSLAGLPIRADTKIDLTFAKLSVTQVFDTTLWGGTPALNINIPYVFDAKLSFIGQTPPIDGIPITDTTSGVGDVTVTGVVGWHRENLHYSAALSVFAPTGSYSTATIDVANRTIDALNTGKNIWSIQPVFAITHLDPATGVELSGSASVLFSTRNQATDYQNAPAVNLEAAVLQHLKSGWAFGATGYAYKQIGDDSGSGAENTKAFLGADSLSAQVFGLGPIVTYAGANLFGNDVSFQLKYYSEFGAKRRFESNTLWLNASLAF